MWFDETNIMMKWKSQWTRMFLLAVGICPCGQLEDQDEKRCSADTSSFFPECHCWQENRPSWNLRGDCLHLLSSTNGSHPNLCCVKMASRQVPLGSMWSLLVQRMTSFNEVRIHNGFACHVLVHIINITASSTPLSLISPGLEVHDVSGPRPHHPSFHLPLPGWMWSFPYVISRLLSVYSFACMKSLHVESAFWRYCQFTLRLILWQCSRYWITA